MDMEVATQIMETSMVPMVVQMAVQTVVIMVELKMMVRTVV